MSKKVTYTRRGLLQLLAPLTQVPHYVSNDPFPRSMTEIGLDRETHVSQGIKALDSRAIRASDSDAAPSMALPASGEPANLALMAGNNGNITTGAPASQAMTQALISQLLTPQTAAEAAASVTPTDYSYPEGHVARYGALGDGLTDDTTAIQHAAHVINAAGGGTITFERGKNYKVWVGASPSLIYLTRTAGVSVNFNGATLTSGRTNGPGVFAITLDGCTRTTIKGGKVQGSNTTLTRSTGEALLNLLNGTTSTRIERCHTKNCATFMQAGDGKPPPLTGRVRGITILNVIIEDTYYGLGFTGNGDDVFARGIIGIHTGRVYFAWNVKNHDVYVDGQQEGPFSDCLLKCYGYTGAAYTSLENIRLYYKTEGKSAAAVAPSANDALISLEVQLHDATGIAYVRGIDVQFNIDVGNDAASATIVRVFNTTKYDATGTIDSIARGHVIENVRVGGVIKNWQNSGAYSAATDAVMLFDNGTYGRGPTHSYNWTGDFAENIRVEDLVIHDSTPSPTIYGVRVNGQPFQAAKPGLTLRNIDASNLRVGRVNWSDTLDFIGESVYGNPSNLVIPAAWTSYTPAWASSGALPSIGNGTLSGKWRRSGDMVTVSIHIRCGSTTIYGTGDYRFAVPVKSGSVGKSIGNAVIQDSGGLAYPMATVVEVSEAVMRLWSQSAVAPGRVTGTSPMRWSTNSVGDLTCTYHADISD